MASGVATGVARTAASALTSRSLDGESRASTIAAADGPAAPAPLPAAAAVVTAATPTPREATPSTATTATPNRRAALMWSPACATGASP